ncbi:hypothetical protein ACWEQL_27990 [Kitasatospora sp. NPDC004240]
MPSPHGRTAPAAEISPTAPELLRGLQEEIERGVLPGRRVTDVGDSEVYVTRIGAEGGMPALTVAYVYTPLPPPPTAAIHKVLPAEDRRED